MIDADQFVMAAAERGMKFYSGVPCSYLQPLINAVIDSEHLRYVAAANEGDAVGVAAGATLCGQGGVVLFQNSGLGNAVNPLTSLTWIYRIPVLIIVTLRGDPGGPSDEPQHELMGAITIPMLEMMNIRWEYFPDKMGNVGPALDRARAYMRESSLPYALVMRKGAAAPFALDSAPIHRVAGSTRARPKVAQYLRREMLEAVQCACGPNDAIVTTTGYTSRELYALGDRGNQFYMVGSMGCASSLALGVALAQPGRKVVVVDGDGAAIMRLGAMTTIGHEQPRNLIHVLLNNQVYESTGGQPTSAGTLNFCSIAAGCGYPAVVVAETPASLSASIREGFGQLSFVEVPIRSGVESALPRPSQPPRTVARRFEEFLRT